MSTHHFYVPIHLVLMKKFILQCDSIRLLNDFDGFDYSLNWFAFASLEMRKVKQFQVQPNDLMNVKRSFVVIASELRMISFASIAINKGMCADRNVSAVHIARAQSTEFNG